jgi:hypothetical protein
MSGEVDWDFASDDDVKVTIRAAARYLLKSATGGVQGDIVQEIMTIVRQVANGPPPSPFILFTANSSFLASWSNIQPDPFRPRTSHWFH